MSHGADILARLFHTSPRSITVNSFVFSPSALFLHAVTFSRRCANWKHARQIPVSTAVDTIVAEANRTRDERSVRVDRTNQCVTPAIDLLSQNNRWMMLKWMFCHEEIRPLRLLWSQVRISVLSLFSRRSRGFFQSQSGSVAARSSVGGLRMTSCDRSPRNAPALSLLLPRTLRTLSLSRSRTFRLLLSLLSSLALADLSLAGAHSLPPSLSLLAMQPEESNKERIHPERIPSSVRTTKTVNNVRKRQERTYLLGAICEAVKAPPASATSVQRRKKRESPQHPAIRYRGCPTT